MVIGNNGSLFSGGFNLAEASAQVFNKDWDGLTKSLDRFHDLFLK
jgi:hypothetical protein